MKSFPVSLKKIAFAIVGFFVILLLFLWQGLPRIIQWQAPEFIAGKTSHHLTLDLPEFNPFQLALRLGKLQLTEPDGKPLLSFDGLLIDISAASITKMALVFDAIRIDNPAVTVIELPEGKLNWTPFIEALKSKEPEPEEKTGLPRLDIRSFVLAGGKIDFADRRSEPGYANHIEPLDLELSNVSTLPDDSGKFNIAAQTKGGAKLALEGGLDLDPLTVNGRVSLQDLQLAQFGPYLNNVLPAAPEGIASLSALYKVGNAGDKLDVAVDQIEMKLANLKAMLKEDGTSASVDAIELKNGRYTLSSQKAALDAIGVSGGKFTMPDGTSAGIDTVQLQNAQVKLAAPEATVAAIAVGGIQAVLPGGKGAKASIAGIDLMNIQFQSEGQRLAVASVALNDIRTVLPRIAKPPQLASLKVEDIQLALAEHKAVVGVVALSGGRVQARRAADGGIDLLEAFKSLVPSGSKAAAKPVAKPAEPSAPWGYRVGKIGMADFGIVLADAGVSPPVELALDKIEFSATGISDDLKAALPVQMAFDVRSGGRFEARGKVVPAEPAVDMNFKLASLALKLAQPYVAAKTTLTLADGKFSTQGRAIYNAKGPNVKGGFDVRNLRLTEAGLEAPLLAWESFGTRDLAVTQKQLDIGELHLVGLDTRILIDKDKNVNLKKVMRQPAEAEAPADQKVVEEKPTAQSADKPVEPSSSVAATSKEPPAFVVNIDRVSFEKGAMDFADQSLVLPFGTRIHNLRGSMANLSNVPGAPGQLELDGDVDDYGLARAVGQVDLFEPTDFMDLRVVFRNVEMTRLTPYTATFAGRKIDTGKLSLDLQYKIKQRQLQGENQVVIDKLTLGERVESPTAKDLPLDLAIAILSDSDGRIDLGLPVAGNLDDPRFSYGAIVWKAITNVLTKIVTAPFRALASLFGGGEVVESIVFDAGVALPTPPEREKIVKLAGVLAKRPSLALKVGGNHADVDRVALQDVQLRRAVFARMGQKTDGKTDPGPLATRNPKVQEALEALYKDRVGASDLAALKEGYRLANPGKLEEGVAGKMMSRLSGMLREKKTLSADEVEKLKGTDFHAELYERLRDKEKVSVEQLTALAQARAASVVEIIGASGVAPERLQLMPPEKGESTQDDVPVRLALEPFKPAK